MSVRLGLLAAMLCAAPATGQEAPTPPASVPEALVAMRKDVWGFVDLFVKSQLAVDPAQYPGIAAWVADLDALRRAIADKPPAEWQVDPDKLTTSNPNYWAMVYEVYPGDPMLLNLTAALRMMGGEGYRARHCTALAECAPGRPALLRRNTGRLNWWLHQLFRLSREAIQHGIAKHDARDFDGAIAIYRAHLAEWPQDGLAHYELGQSLMARDPKSILEADAPHVTEYALSRRHHPMEWMAWQGLGTDMVEKMGILRSDVTPAWTAIQQRTADAAAVARFSEGVQKLAVHDLALIARQTLAGMQLGYSKADRECIATSLRALVPGEVTEKTIGRLSGPEPPIRSITRFEGPAPDFRWER